MRQIRCDKTNKLFSLSTQGTQARQAPCSPHHTFDMYHLNQGGSFAFVLVFFLFDPQIHTQNSAV